MAPPLIVEEELKKATATVPFTKGDERRSISEASEGDENKKAIPTALWAPPLIVEEELKNTTKTALYRKRRS